MTFPFRSIGTARTTPTPIAGFVVLAALLAGCSSETAPTGWIPSDGAITGVITTTNAFPAPRHGSVLAASARGTSDRVPLLTAPGIAAFLSRLPRGALRARRLPRVRPVATAHDLLVTFRNGALGAPPVGSATLATRASARLLGAAMRSRFAAMLPAGVVVAGVSPSAVFADPVADKAGDPEGHLARLSRDWGVSVILYTTLTSASAGSLRRLGGCGIRHVVFHGHDDSVRRLAAVCECGPREPPPPPLRAA